MGRKSKSENIYDTNIRPNLDKIPEWYLDMSVRQIAKKMGVSKSSLYKYAAIHPELADALQMGKEDLIDELRSAIKQRARGYTAEDVIITEEKDIDGHVTVTTKRTVRHIPADLGSAHLLLKNLDPDWRNDDATTLALKERELKIKEEKAEAEKW